MTVKNRCGTDMVIVMEKFEVLSQHFHERTEGNQESVPPLSGQLILGLNTGPSKYGAGKLTTQTAMFGNVQVLFNDIG